MERYLNKEVRRTSHGEYTYDIFYGPYCMVTGKGYADKETAEALAEAEYKRLVKILEN